MLVVWTLYLIELAERILLVFWTLYLIELAEDLAFFFQNSILNCLLRSFIWLSKTLIPDNFLGGGRAIVFQAPISKIKRDFPSNFSWSIFFFLLASCFYSLRPLQIVLLKLSWRAGRTEIRRFVGGRVQGIGPCCPLCYSLSDKGKF